ncbi:MULTISPECIES: DUF2384 domain-containing protein [Photorhabdus]|uniref:DUF2384 domain-containing protein n=1 Tax=Photorhabdus TaxID=29487 RepID=UPI000DCEC262|nr:MULTISPECIES: DUF2384 domain-containing protein [Photorhabdus]MCT8341362.1 DUF2384 domain-containing protein [Photorhabdus kleinii]RAW98720.1 DUF2384 domain-containing protein [Photorhabdus sp. S10-54]RAW98812.1 DUF2384 domain-containing protein [Photorhabdus sp. S9-53]RAX03004.1 DUF2384 domain-containing protein [Photorhabdus sp. S8-52]
MITKSQTKSKHVSFNFLSMDTIELSNNKDVAKHINLSDIPVDEADQYVVVKLPRSIDYYDIKLAIASAVTAVTTFNKHKHLPLVTEPSESEFAYRNEARLEKLKNQILTDSKWLTASELSRLTGSKSINSSAAANRLKKSKKIFALPINGKDLFPLYALDEGGQPLPVIKNVIELFKNKTPWSIAIWFGTPNSWLSNKKPKDLLLTQLDDVYMAAKEEVEGPRHG